MKSVRIVTAGVIAMSAAATLALSTGSAMAGNSCGRASWYALHSTTASGEKMNPGHLTAAHRSLPFGSVVKVVNKRNGKAVNVRINDRGPFVRGRIIDVSKAAAHQLGFAGNGVTSVCISRIN